MHSLGDAIAAGEFAGLAAYCRAVLGRAASDEPEVVSLRLSCTLDTPGLSVIEVELIERNGLAVGGFSL